MREIAGKEGDVAIDEDINAESEDDNVDEPRSVPVVVPAQPINLLDDAVFEEVLAPKVAKVIRPPAVIPAEPVHAPLPQPKAPPPKLSKQQMQVAKDKIQNQSMDKFVVRRPAVVPPPKSAFVPQRTLDPPPAEEDDILPSVFRPF